MKPNSKDLQQWAANADRMAPILAKLSTGTELTLADRERGFKLLLKNKCEPVYIEVTPWEMVADVLMPAPARFFAGFGLGSDCAPVFTTCWISAAGLADREIWTFAHRELEQRLVALGVEIEGVVR